MGYGQAGAAHGVSCLHDTYRVSGRGACPCAGIGAG